MSQMSAQDQDGNGDAALTAIDQYSDDLRLNLGTRFGKDANEAYLDTAVPLFVRSQGDAGLFLNVYGESFTLRGSTVTNGSLGLSARALVPELNSIINLRGHLDASESMAGNNYARVGLGFDVLHESGIDLHFNYYFGKNLRNNGNAYSVLDRSVSGAPTTSTSSSLTGSRSLGFRTDTLPDINVGAPFTNPNPVTNRTVERADTAGPFGRNNGILQRIFTDIYRGEYDTLQQRQRRTQRVETFQDTFADTTTTTSTDLRFQQFEDMAEGFDIRIEGKIFPDSYYEGPNSLEGMIGAYHYNMPFGEDLKGIMAGIYYTPSEVFRAGVTYYGDEEYFGGSGNVVGTVQVSLPFDFASRVRREGGIVGALRSGFAADSEPPTLQQRFYSDHAARRNRVLTETSDVLVSTRQSVSTQTSSRTAEREVADPVVATTVTDLVSSSPEEIVLTVFRDEDITPDVDGDGNADAMVFVSNGTPAYNTDGTAEAGSVAEDVQGTFNDPVTGNSFTFAGLSAQPASGAVGTASNPATSIQAGANALQTGALTDGYGNAQASSVGTVWVEATGTPYTEDVFVAPFAPPAGLNTAVAPVLAAATSDIHFTSSFVGINNTTISPTNFGGTTARPDVDGSFTLRNIEGGQVEGFSITTGAAVNLGIGSGNTQNAGIVFSNVTETIINENITTGTDRAGITVNSRIGATVDSVLISDNQVLGVNLLPASNEVSGIIVQTLDANSEITAVTISDNVVEDIAGQNGIRVASFSDANTIGNITVDRNEISRVGAAGIQFDDGGLGSVMVISSASQNTIRDAGQSVINYGITIQLDQNTSNSVGNIDSNDIQNVNGSGIRIANTASGYVLPVTSVSGNLIDGIRAENAAGANNGQQANSGIIFVANAGSFAIADLSNNQIGTRTALIRGPRDATTSLASNGIFFRDNNTGVQENITVNGTGNIVIFDNPPPAPGATATVLDTGDALKVNLQPGNTITGSSLEVNSVTTTLGGGAALVAPISQE